MDGDDDKMTFTIEEELLFTQRFEENYDLPDARYDSWLKLNHPDAEVVMVPDSEPSFF